MVKLLKWIFATSNQNLERIMSDRLYRLIVAGFALFHFAMGVYLKASLETLLIIILPFLFGTLLNKYHKKIIKFVTNWTIGSSIVLIILLIEYGEFFEEITELYESFGRMLPFCFLLAYLAFKVKQQLSKR